MKALLIIDMQIGCFKPYTSRYNTLQIISQINLLSNCFRSSGYLVVYIVHNGSKEDYLYPNTKDFEILPELKIESSDNFVVKEANEAFYKTNLDDILKKNGVAEVYICGCATNYCVDATIKSALSKDYKLVVASDAHTTRNCDLIEARILIEYYNWLWSNMTPTKHGISMQTTKEIVDELEQIHSKPIL